VVERATVELMNTYSRQFGYQWQGGELVTRDVTIGGTLHDGLAAQANFNLADGEWICTDTTIRYCYGLVVGGSPRGGKLRATRLIAGPNPDSIIMFPHGDAIVRDSAYVVSLRVDLRQGGRGVLDLPVNTPITQVYDGAVLPGARYRLELVNTTVRLWYLLAEIATDGPPAELVLHHCPAFVPLIAGTDLRGTLHLPSTRTEEGSGPGLAPGTVFRTGSTIWRVGEEPVRLPCWGLYLSGERTDLTIPGPSVIVELFLWGGKVVLLGGERTYDLWLTGTTVEVGQFGVETGELGGSPSSVPQAELVVRYARLSPFEKAGVRGQVVAHNGGAITVEHARCRNMLFMTRGDGRITLEALEDDGEVTLLETGGPIRRSGGPSERS
jgi:hypothetical protein